MPLDRRSFFKAGVAAATMAAVPHPLLVRLARRPEPVPPIDDPRLADLAARALDVARTEGAVYADVRLTHTKNREFNTNGWSDDEDMVVGVRALVDGYWGFASGPVWSPDEMARLGREAVHQAKVNALGKPRVVTLAPAAVIRDGHWVMPIQLDPFELSPLEIVDHLLGLLIFGTRFPDVEGTVASAGSTVQDKAFASTAGNFCTQRTYRTHGQVAVFVKLRERQRAFDLDCLSGAGMGWELFVADRIPRVRDHSVREEIQRLIEECKEDMLLPVKPIDVGRYDTVLDAISMARLLDATLGRATELDRAMGYEANAGGTSYLNDPLGMLGSFQVGGPLVTVTGNRSDPGAVATVKWDDEGVTPDDFTLVKNGVLTDFQTTRESAGWLPTATHSHGCANAPSAIDAPLTHSPNLMLAAGREVGDFTTLVSNVSNGIAVKSARFEMDFQAASGLALGNVFAIKAGKRVSQLPAAGLLFRSSELWKSLAATGADASLRRFGMSATKGEPPQACFHSVTVAPGMVKGLTLIDALRKA
jgi:TldD protein